MLARESTRIFGEMQLGYSKEEIIGRFNRRLELMRKAKDGWLRVATTLAEEKVLDDMDWDQFDHYVDMLHGQMTNTPYVPTCIVGLARGGLPLAVCLSHKFGVPMIPVTFQTRDGDKSEWIKVPQDGLVVDDINDSGETLDSFMAGQHKSVRTAVLINKPSSRYNVDYAAYTAQSSDDDVWYQFPWEK